MLTRYADQIFLGIAALAGALVLATALFLLARVVSNGLLKKELRHFFVSPIAWLVMAGFVFINGFFFLFLVEYYSGTFANIPFTTVFFGEGSIMWILLLIVVPAITMRLIAEEKATGTIETLMTAPVRDAEFVFAKYAAALAFYVVMWLGMLPLFASLYYYGLPAGTWADLQSLAASGHWSNWQLVSHFAAKLNDVMDFGPFFCTYFGLLLLGSAWISIGLLASSFAKNQVVAFMAAFVVLMLLFLVGYLENLVHSDPSWFPHFLDVVRYVTFTRAFEKFPKGVVDTRAVVYFVSLTVVSLFFAVRVVESRKWR
jgi:ABC-2 type transport system permease protein